MCTRRCLIKQDKEKQQGGKGTGLGLALVRQIVKPSGGRRLGVSSRVGKGSTFWVELRTSSTSFILSLHLLDALMRCILSAFGVGLQAIEPLTPSYVSLDDGQPPSPHFSVGLMNKVPPPPHLVIDVGLPRASTGQGARRAGGDDA